MKNLRLVALIGLAAFLLALPVLGEGENETVTAEGPAQEETLPATQPEQEPATQPSATDPVTQPETTPATQETPPVTQEKVEGVIRSVSVSVALPTVGQAGEEVLETNVKIAALVNGVEKILSAPLEFGLDGSDWYDASSGTPVKMGENDLFIKGREYRVRIRFEIYLNGLTPDGKTLFYVNGKDAKLSTRGSSYEMEASFVCTPPDITPKVSLVVEEAEKVYDGTPVKLKLEVEKTDGVLYRYEWYRDGVVVTSDGPEVYEVKNATQSGKYHCKVYATTESDSGDTAYATETMAHQITVSPRSITVQIENAEKNLFDDDPEFTYTVIGDMFDELLGSPEREAGEDIGTYEIGKGTLAFSPDVSENYSVEFRSGHFSVLKVDELPFSAVSGIGDVSYITGKNGSRIRISASKGALPKGGIIKLDLAEDSAKAALESASGKEVLKCFAVSIVDAEGNAIAMPKHASLKVLIPLTEEEEDFLPETLSAGIYTTAASLLDSAVTEEAGVRYVSVHITELGAIAVFEGQKKAVEVKPEPTQKAPVPEDKNPVILWVCVVLLTFLSMAGAAFTYFYIRKNGLPKKVKKPVEKKPLTRAQQMEKQRVRRIADEMNALPPVPKNSPQKPPVKKDESGAEKTVRVVSFDDLEES